MDRMEVTETFAGISLPGHLHTEESLRFASSFQFQDTDVVIVTYPKSGKTSLLHRLCCWVPPPCSRHNPELEGTAPLGAGQGRACGHCSCLRVCLTPMSFVCSRSQVIYMARNPKDVAVSFYHFHKMARVTSESQPSLLSAVQYGSWFDHVKGWLSQRAELDLFYITYEDLHQLGRSVERLADWLGCPLQPEESRAIQQHCSFSSMRENTMVNYTLIPCEIMDHSRGRFMRKGTGVGDWRDHFTPVQNMHFHKIYQEEMQDSSLRFRGLMD
uniref:Sulfotransferase n=1 Tax=Chelonoidis abingdonii TaxID=106734 RepID=A0A8C0GDR3_CHEAB